MASPRDTAPDEIGGGRHRRVPAVRPSRHAPADVEPEFEPGGEPDVEQAEIAEIAEVTDVLPVVRTRDERPATGLAKFDLGTIPASVTPPRTWRHAAWFSVFAAILVLVGFTYAAVSLVSGPRKPDVVDALPGLPSLRADLPSGPPTGLVLKTTTPGLTTTTVSPTRTTASPGPNAPPLGAATTGAAAEPTPAWSATTSAATAPVRSTVASPVLFGAQADADTIGDRTETYYRRVASDPAAASAMTAGQLRRGGETAIERRYPGVRRVEVQQIVIDPGRGTTRSVLRLVRADGSVTTVERRLTFTTGPDPRITGDAATS